MAIFACYLDKFMVVENVQTNNLAKWPTFYVLRQRERERMQRLKRKIQFVMDRFVITTDYKTYSTSKIPSNLEHEIWLWIAFRSRRRQLQRLVPLIDCQLLDLHLKPTI